jgi:hypothetical protein
MLYKEQIVEGMNEVFGAKNITTTVKSFDQYTIITRAANTTQYAAGQLISGISASNLHGDISGYNGSTLIPIDLTSDGATGSQRIQITQCSILSDQNPSTSILIPIVQFFNNALSGLADFQAFAPTFATLNSYRQAILQSEFTNTVNSGSNAYYIMAADFTRLVNVDSNGIIWVAPVANNAYTPKSGEQIKIRIRGFLL